MTEKRRAGIPVVFHNGSGYDWKFLMKELGNVIEEDEKLSVEVQICDTGVGIAPQKLDEIFQLGFTTKGDKGNIGLGLWLTKREVEGLGGVLKYDSSLDHGSSFTVILPAYISNN